MIISSFIYEQAVYHSIYKNLKHISVDVCIFAVYEFMVPFIVAP